jgi:hypothetical protein
LVMICARVYALLLVHWKRDSEGVRESSGVAFDTYPAILLFLEVPRDMFTYQDQDDIKDGVQQGSSVNATANECHQGDERVYANLIEHSVSSPPDNSDNFLSHVFENDSSGEFTYHHLSAIRIPLRCRSSEYAAAVGVCGAVVTEAGAEAEYPMSGWSYALREVGLILSEVRGSEGMMSHLTHAVGRGGGDASEEGAGEIITEEGGKHLVDCTLKLETALCEYIEILKMAAGE